MTPLAFSLDLPTTAGLVTLIGAVGAMIVSIINALLGARGRGVLEGKVDAVAAQATLAATHAVLAVDQAVIAAGKADVVATKIDDVAATSSQAASNSNGHLTALRTENGALRVEISTLHSTVVVLAGIIERRNAAVTAAATTGRPLVDRRAQVDGIEPR